MNRNRWINLVFVSLLLILLFSAQTVAAENLIRDGLVTMRQVTEVLDGSIWDPVEKVWLPATPESLAAANEAVIGFASKGLDLLEFPLEFSFMGITIEINREAMDLFVESAQAIMRIYVQHTTAEVVPLE